MALTISSKGWVVIPANLREKYRLTPGARVEIIDYGGVLAIVPIPDSPIQAAIDLLKSGPSLTEALLDDHAEEIRRGR